MEENGKWEEKFKRNKIMLIIRIDSVSVSDYIIILLLIFGYRVLFFNEYHLNFEKKKKI